MEKLADIGLIETVLCQPIVPNGTRETSQFYPARSITVVIMQQKQNHFEEDDLPCRMMVEELRAEVQESAKDAEKGLGITVEEARAMHPREASPYGKKFVSKIRKSKREYERGEYSVIDPKKFWHR
jgi:hypothetical protein